MTVTNAQIRAALDRYLARFPDERDRVGLLEQALLAETICTLLLAVT